MKTVALLLALFLASCGTNHPVPNNPRWPASAEAAAHDLFKLKCKELIYQQPYQTIDEAIQNVRPDVCLVLLADSPYPTNTVCFGYGGQYNGVDILYFSDTAHIKIWNGISL